MGTNLEPGAYRALLLTTGVGVFLLAACAAKTPPPPGPDAVFVVDEAPAAPVQVELDPLTLSVEVAPESFYVPWESTGEGGDTALRIERTSTSGANGDPGETTWRVSRFFVAADGTETAQKQDDFLLTADGSVALAQTDDFVESVRVIFEPPMVVVPIGLVPGDTFTQQVAMSVYDAGKADTPRTQGMASQEVTYVADERIRTPAVGPDDGQWASRHLRSVFTVQLGPAQVRNQLDQWFVDGVGIVAEQRHERTSAMGVAFRNNLERWVLRSAEGIKGTGPVAAIRTRGTPDPARPAPGSPAGASTPPSSPPAADTQRPWTAPSPRQQLR